MRYGKLNSKNFSSTSKKKVPLSDNWEIVWVVLLSIVFLQIFFGLSLSSSSDSADVTEPGMSSWADSSFSDSNTEVPVGPETRQFTQERVEE